MKHAISTLFIVSLTVLIVTGCRPNGREHGSLMPGIRPYHATTSSDQPRTETSSNTSTERTNSSRTNATRQEWGDRVVDSLCQVRGAEGRLLHRVGYLTLYDATRRCPRWTAWHLTRDHIAGPYKRKGISFQEDEEVGTPRATDMDYQRSGYDRGHMCPSGDNQWNQQAQEQSFLFTNICPQAPSLNRGEWNDLEIQCRTWAREKGGIWVVCGPVWLSERPRRLGRNKVNVPDGFFKVVLSMEGQPQAIGFYYVNDDQPDSSIADHATTVDAIERMTGLDFFSVLPDEVERRIEAKADINAW